MQFLPNYRSCVGFVCTTLCVSTVLQMLPWVVIVQAFHQIVYNASKMHSIVMIYRIYWMQYIISSYLTQCNQYCSFKSDCTECNDISKRVLSSPIRPPHLRSCKGLSGVTCTFFKTPHLILLTSSTETLPHAFLIATNQHFPEFSLCTALCHPFLLQYSVR